MGFVKRRFNNYRRTNLLAEYLFDGNANDTSGNGHDGTVSGATLATDRFGNFNATYDFSNDKITSPNSTDFNFGTSPFSISCWVNTDVLLGIQTILIFGECKSPSNANQVLIYILSTGEIRLYIVGTTPAQYNTFNTGYFVNISTWYHIVMLRTATGSELYVNGVSVYSASYPATNPNLIFTCINSIGAYYKNAVHSNFFNGKIDDVRIFDRVLTPYEIKTLTYKKTA